MNNLRDSSRPMTVKAAVISLLVCVVLFVGKFTFDIGLQQPLAYLIAFVFVGIFLLQVWFIFKGKNWARLIFVAVVVLGLIPSYVSILEPLRLLTKIYSLVQIVLQLASAIALILPASTNWYRE